MNKEQIIETKQQVTNLLSNKAVRFFILFIIVVFLTLFFLPFFLNYESFKFDLEQKISQALNANFTAQEVSSAILPTPRVIIRDVKITNFVKSDKIIDAIIPEINIKIGLSDIFSRSFNIKKIILKDAKIQSYYKTKPPLGKKNDIIDLLNNVSGRPVRTAFSIFSSQEINKEDFTLNKIPIVIFENGSLQYYNQSGSYKTISGLKLKIKNKINQTEISGQFLIDDSINKVNAITDFTGSSPTKIEINSAEMNLVLLGKFSPPQKQNIQQKNDAITDNFNGTIALQINNLRSFYQKYISNDDFLLNKINPLANSVKLNANINKNEGEVKIGNLLINSELIKGKGEIRIDLFSKVPIFDINLDLESINLDKLKIDKSVYENQLTNNQNEFERLAEKNFDKNQNQNGSNDIDDNEKLKENNEEPKVKRNFELTAEVTVKNIELLKGQVKDVDLYLLVSSSNQSILIQPLIFNTPGQGTVRINGTLSGDNRKPKFVGKIDSFGTKLSDTLKWLKIELQNLKYENLKDYTLYSDLLFSDNTISLNNFYLTLNDSENEILGNIKIEKSGKVTNILSKFLINQLNLDDFFFISQKNTYLSSGLLLKKMFWLNNINSNSVTSLSFDKLTYKNENFQNQKITFGLSQGYLEVNNLELQSDSMNLKTNFVFDIREKTPRLEASIKAKKFNYHTMKNEKSLLDEETSSIAQNINLLNRNKNADFDFFDQFFALPSLSGVNGNVNFSFEDLRIDETEIKNLNLAGKITDGSVDIDDMTGEIFDGKFSYEGQIVIKGDKAINGNLNLNDIKLKPFLVSIFKTDKIDGVANISSSITSMSQNKKEFAQNIKLNSKFSAGNIDVTGFGLNDLITKMFQPNQYLQELQEPESILFNTKKITNFSKAIGQIQINKDKENKMQISFETQAANGVLSGKLDLVKNTIDATTNIIFLTGNSETQIPINIASNIKGEIRDPSQNTNTGQIKQYIDRIQGK